MWTIPYDNKSWISRTDRFWSYAEAKAAYALPLIVTLSGFSNWDGAVVIERARSRVFSVELVVAGEARVVQNGRRFTARPGQAFLLHKGAAHRFTAGAGGFLRKRMVVLDGIILDTTLRSLGLLDVDVVTCADPARFAAMIKRTNALMGAYDADNAWRLSALAYEILLELGANLVADAFPPQIRKALAFMSRNISAQLTLDQIAAAGGLSRFHFSRLFRQSLSCTPVHYFQRQKMALAKNLLANSDLLIKEIAAALGYDDPFYFTAQFRKAVGTSPREFRQSGSDQTRR